jgi:hypothetical protein
MIKIVNVAIATIAIALPFCAHAQSQQENMGTPEAFRPHGTPSSIGLGPCSRKSDQPIEGCYPSKTLGVGPQPQGRYLHSRWAEDWSFLRNGGKPPEILGDAVYAASGLAYAGTQGGHSSRIGTCPASASPGTRYRSSASPCWRKG